MIFKFLLYFIDISYIYDLIAILYPIVALNGMKYLLKFYLYLKI